MATQVDEKNIELARDSLEGMSQRSASSTGRASTSSTDSSVPTAAQRFAAVDWEEPPDEPETEEAVPDKTSAAETSEASSPPTVQSAAQKFASIPWEEPPDEPEDRVGEGESEWAEKMKLKNFFEGAGW